MKVNTALKLITVLGFSAAAVSCAATKTKKAPKADATDAVTDTTEINDAYIVVYGPPTAFFEEKDAAEGNNEKE